MMKHIDFLDDTDKAEALERAAEDLWDHSSACLDHVHAAKRDIRRCIDVCRGSLTGRALDEHLQQLLEIEGDLSRAEGELTE